MTEVKCPLYIYISTKHVSNNKHKRQQIHTTLLIYTTDQPEKRKVSITCELTSWLVFLKTLSAVSQLPVPSTRRINSPFFKPIGRCSKLLTKARSKKDHVRGGINLKFHFHVQCSRILGEYFWSFKTGVIQDRFYRGKCKIMKLRARFLY
jgi:hypothetical protein